MDNERDIINELIKTYNEIKNELGIGSKEIEEAIQELEKNDTRDARIKLDQAAKRFRDNILYWRKKFISEYKKIYEDLKRIEKDVKGNYSQHLDNLESLEKEVKKDIKKAKEIVKDLEKISVDIAQLRSYINSYEKDLRSNKFVILREEPEFQKLKEVLQNSKLEYNRELALISKIAIILEGLEQGRKDYRLERQDLAFLINLFKTLSAEVKKFEESTNFEKLEELEKKYEEKSKNLENAINKLNEKLFPHKKEHSSQKATWLKRF